MFRVLLADPQEGLNKRHLVYCVRVMSVACTRNEAEACACAAIREDEQVMLETCRCP
jgi:hypothetical protein